MISTEARDLHCIDLEFVARRKILSLPPWHGARWHALLREACHTLPFALDDLVLSCRPERNGARPILPGDKLRLHLIAPGDALSRLPDFLLALALCHSRGEFSMQNLELLTAKDGITGKLLWQPGQGWLADPVAFHAEFLLAEASALAELGQWTLRFLSPLRLPLPPGHPERGREQDKYASPDFLRHPSGLQWLLGRLRFCAIDEALPVDNLELQDFSLAWDDMRYNEKRKIALGGIGGQLVWRGRPNLRTALALVLGRHFGAGKNPRFGLGFWHIPELDARSAPAA